MKLNDFKKENVIDLRSEKEYLKFHLNGSRNINYIDLLINTDKYLNKRDNYLLICDKGIQSMDVSNILKRKGYHTYSLDGGMKKMLAKF